jgi:hypothetical protein
VKLEFLNSLSKNTEISNSVKIRPVEADLFRAEEQTDGQADMINLVVAFRSFVNAANRNEHVLVVPVPTVHPNIILPSRGFRLTFPKCFPHECCVWICIP